MGRRYLSGILAGLVAIMGAGGVSADEILYEDTFDGSSTVGNTDAGSVDWFYEGYSSAAITGGRLFFEALGTGAPHANVWCTQHFDAAPGDGIQIEYTYQCVNQHSDDLGMVMFLAEGAAEMGHPTDIFTWTRDGEYNQYIEHIDMYSFAYHRLANGQTNSTLRKNITFHQLNDATDPVRDMSLYYIRVVVQGESIQCYVRKDGETEQLIHDVMDNSLSSGVCKCIQGPAAWSGHVLPCTPALVKAPHSSGWMSFRHMNTQQAYYDDFRVTRLINSSAEPAGSGSLMKQGSFPNPFRSRAWIPLIGPASEACPSGKAYHVWIYNAEGRMIKRFALSGGSYGPGKDTGLYWNGLDELGRRVPGGSYYYRIIGGASSPPQRFVLSGK